MCSFPCGLAPMMLSSHVSASNWRSSPGSERLACAVSCAIVPVCSAREVHKRHRLFLHAQLGSSDWHIFRMAPHTVCGRRKDLMQLSNLKALGLEHTGRNNHKTKLIDEQEYSTLVSDRPLSGSSTYASRVGSAQ